MNALHIRNQDLLLKNQLLFLNIFWAGFFIFQIGSTLNASESKSIKVLQAFQALGLVLIAIGSTKLMKFKIENGYLRIIFIFYMIWLMVVFFRGVDLPISYDFIKTTLFSSGGNAGLFYLAPLILLFQRNEIFYKKLFDVIIIFCILYWILDIIFIKKLLSHGADETSKNIVESLADLSLPAGFILMTYKFHSNKKIFIALVAIILALFLAIIRARRGLAVITFSIIFFSYLLLNFNSKRKLIVIYLSILIMSLGAIYVSNMYNIGKNRIVGFLAERGDEDTRNSVELFFYDDMKTNDWIIGKGLTGKYFCPDVEEDQLTNYRSLIETGYLQVILKGGIISLSLLFLIIIPAFIKGIFFSKNLFAKAAGNWILVFIISLYPSIPTSFTLNYLLIWISVGICFSNDIRKMSNEDIDNQFFISR